MVGGNQVIDWEFGSCLRSMAYIERWISLLGVKLVQVSWETVGEDYLRSNYGWLGDSPLDDLSIIVRQGGKDYWRRSIRDIHIYNTHNHAYIQ